ncbi:MAG: ABC transporter ATP-binding protein [Vulcanimicrobiaceae bacterium]
MTRQAILSRLASEARPYFPRLLAAVLLGAVAGALPIVPPWALGQIVGRVIAPPHGHAPDLEFLYLALTLTFCSLALTNVATYFQTYLTAWSGQRLIATWRVRLFSRVLELPVDEYDKWRPGELISRFSSDLQMMTDAVSISLPLFFAATVTFLVSLGYMIKLDWLLTVTLVVAAPIVTYIVSNFQKLISQSTRRTQERIADLSANLTEILQAQRVVKSFGRETFEVERFRNRNDAYFGASMKLIQFINTQPMIVATLMAFAVVVIVWLSVREVLVGRLDKSTVFTYWLLLVNLANPLNRFAQFTSDLSKATVACGRVLELLDLAPEDEGLEAPAMQIAHGEIVFDDVVFGYQNSERPALDGVSATIAAGEVVALVGPSGAGKTTLANLVPRFYRPQKGAVLVDGRDLSGVRLADLRRGIAIVPQDPQLFRTSIMENIRYGRLDATDDEVREAAREANADEFIERFPEGYQTEVGERGARLSGGERQRIAIARAILRDPRILILDEATSALDTHSEAMIESALDRLLPGRTTIVIAHRLSTVRRADRIFYIEDGRLLEAGTQDELLALGGRYAALHAAQFGA